MSNSSFSRALVLAGIAVSLSLLVAVLAQRGATSAPPTEGLVEGAYVNQELGIRIPLLPGWESKDPGAEARNEGGVFLILRTTPDPSDDTSSASLIFSSEPAPAGSSDEDYFTAFLAGLASHPEPPKETTRQPDLVLAGRRFAVYEIVRPYGAGELRILIAADVSAGRALVVSAAFDTEADRREALRQLLRTSAP